MDQFLMMQYLLDPQLLMVLVVVLPLAFWAGWGTRIRHLAAGSVVCVLLFIAGIIADNSYGYLPNAIGMLLCTVMRGVLLGIWSGKLVSVLRQKSAA